MVIVRGPSSFDFYDCICLFMVCINFILNGNRTILTKKDWSFDLFPFASFPFYLYDISEIGQTR